MSVAAATRAAVREHPILLDALRAGVVNYTAAAAWLTSRADLDGDTDAVAAALRRLSEDLPALARASRSARVSMQTGVAVVDAAETEETPLFVVGTDAVVAGGRQTALVATGEVTPTVLAAVIRRMAAIDIDVIAAGVAGETLVVVVSRRDGATAVRVVEDVLAGEKAR